MLLLYMVLREREKGFTSVFLVVLVVVVAITLFLLKSKSFPKVSKETQSIIPKERLAELETQEKTPTMFSAIKKNGDFIIGNLTTKEEHVIVPAKVKLYTTYPNLAKISPDKKHLAYIKLPVAVAQQESYQNNHFSGSHEDWQNIVDNWELHLVDISDLNNPKDTILSREFKRGRGESTGETDIYWTKDSLGFYYRKIETPRKGQSYYYNINTKSHTLSVFPPAPFDDNGNSSFPVFSGETYYYRGNIYNLDGKLQTEISLTRSGDIHYDIDSFYNVLHPSPTSLFISGKTLSRKASEPVWTCYVEFVDVLTKTNYDVEKKECRIQTGDGFKDPILSPNGKFLAVMLDEIHSGTPTAESVGKIYSSEFLIANLETGEKKFLGKQDWRYNPQYFWLSGSELLVRVNAGCGCKPKEWDEDQTFVLNIETGSITPENYFLDKEIREVF